MAEGGVRTERGAQHRVQVVQLLDGSGGTLGGLRSVDRPDRLGKLAADQRIGAQEAETTPQCRVHRRDRPVGAVHRAEEVDVVRKLELPTRVRQRHGEPVAPFAARPAGPFARFHAQQDVAEHLRHVRAVDFVQQDQEVRVGIGDRLLLHDAQQKAVAAAELLVLLVVAHAFHEVLVGGTRVEGERVPATAGTAQFPAGDRGPERTDRTDDMRLSGARRPLDHRVAEPAQEVDESFSQRSQPAASKIASRRMLSEDP